MEFILWYTQTAITIYITFAELNLKIHYPFLREWEV